MVEIKRCAMEAKNDEKGLAACYVRQKEALKHYINDSGADVLMEQKASEEKRYVTMEEQETMKKELKEELRKELLDETRAEVVRLLGQYAAGSHWGSREN